jgi:aldose 1-epimerase
VTSGTGRPTGEQYELQRSGQRLVVVQLGGGLRTYEVDGRPVLSGYREEELPPAAHGQHLVPWPNRLADGRFDWDGRTHQLPWTEPDKRNAIHGLVRWLPFRLVDQQSNRVELGCRLFPQDGWPFCLDLSVTYRLDDAGLTVRTSASNAGTAPLPYGTGCHPYLTAGTPHIDQALLQFRAGSWLPVDRRGLPKKPRRVARSDFDFRRPRRIGSTRIDNAFTDLAREEDGRFRLRFGRRREPSVVFWTDPAYPYLQLFTGDGLPPERRRAGLGVEPMTMPPNGLRTGTDVVRLEPGQAHIAEWGIETSGPALS